jgi:glycosyltransferase involved in cell wall biosynthesis
LCGGIVTIGGAEKMIFSALELFIRKGSSVHCIINDWENEAVADQVTAIGGTWSEGFHREPLRVRNRTPSQIASLGWSTIETSRKMLAVAKRLKPSLVFLSDFGEVLRCAAGLAMLRLRRVPVILYLQNSPPETDRHRRIFRLVVDRLVSRYVVASNHSESVLTTMGIDPQKISYVNNFAPSAATSGHIARDAKKILFAGQIIPQKGLDILLEAFAIVAANDPEARLDIAGRTEGWIAPEYESHRESVLARARQPDLSDRVTFLGWRGDIPDLLKGAAAHCAPSRREMHEGMPLVCLEAKSAATPSVAPDFGPFPEMLSHRVDGWLCPQLTAESLAEGIRYFLSDPAVARDAGEEALRSSSRFSRSEFDRRWEAAVHAAVAV